MPGVDRREVSYTQARNELIRTLQDEFVAELAEPDRGRIVAELVRGLQGRYPDLDDQLTRRLLGEGMRIRPAWRDPL